MGQLANQLRSELEAKLDERTSALAEKVLEYKMRAEAVDVTVPGTLVPLGHKHPMEKILLDLGFGLDGDTILVPSWRGDVEHYSDIAEEVARFYGYNNIPIRFSGGNTRCGGYTEIQEAERLAGVLCRSFGMTQWGMDSRKAISGVMKENTRHMIAAPQMLVVEALRVMATQAMDSP